MKTKLSMIRKTLKTAWELDKKLILLIAAASVINVVTHYIPVILGAYILDGFITGASAAQMLTTTIICFAVLFIVGAVRNLINNVRDVHIETCVMDFEIKQAKRTLDMDYQLLESPEVNALRARMKNDRNWGAGFYSVFWNLPAFLNGILSLVAALAILVPLFLTGTGYQNLLSLAFVGGAAVVALIAGAVTGRTGDRETALLDEINASGEIRKKYGHFNFLYWGGGMDYQKGKDARIYHISNLLHSYFAPFDKWMENWNKRITKVWAAAAFSDSFSGGLIWAGAYIFVTLQAIAGVITIGAVLLYANALNRFARGLTDLASSFSQFAVTAKRQQAVIEYMNFPDVLHKGTLPVEKRRDNEYEIEFRNVSFQYPGSEAYSLRNFSIKLNIGQKLAIVGMNGSGKTTMIKLLCRLYDPTEGVITLNGFDIKKYDYAEYMRIFSVVFQDFKVFSFKLSENIACSTEIDNERATQAIQMVGLSERTEKMPDGLDTYLYSDFDKGVEISGGEAQKIALARALYKDAPFIVLDEPTAALDPIAEFDIYSKFNGIVGDKTAIYISHRLSSCRFCDDIAVFHEGALIQRGNHDTLVADMSGKYYELWNAQAQYYNDEVV